MLADKLDLLAKTPAGTPFPPEAVNLVSLAVKMIEPTFMLDYVDRLHILGEESGDCANMISLAWALHGHITGILPNMKIAHNDMEILRTCRDQSLELNRLVNSVISRLDG